MIYFICLRIPDPIEILGYSFLKLHGLSYLFHVSSKCLFRKLNVVEFLMTCFFSDFKNDDRDQASDFSDVGDWPTLGEAAVAAAVVRPKEEVPTVTVSVINKARTWADEVLFFI